MSDFDFSTPLTPQVETMSPEATLGDPLSSNASADLESRAVALVDSSHLPKPSTGRPRAFTSAEIGRLKELYFNYEPIDTICKILRVSHKTVYRHIGKTRGNGLTWREMRDQNSRQIAEITMENSSHLLKSMTDRSLRLLHLGIEHMHKQFSLDPESLNIRDLERVASIAEKVDRLNRLSDGQATGIMGMIPGEALTQIRAQSIIRSDPFLLPAHVEEIIEEK